MNDQTVRWMGYCTFRSSIAESMNFLYHCKSFGIEESTLTCTSSTFHSIEVQIQRLGSTAIPTARVQRITPGIGINKFQVKYEEQLGSWPQMKWNAWPGGSSYIRIWIPTKQSIREMGVWNKWIRNQENPIIQH